MDIIGVKVETVAPGNVIVEPGVGHGTKKMLVMSVDRTRCLHHVHVNDACYDKGTVVYVAI